MNELQTAALPPILTDSGLANQRLPRQPKSPKVRAGPGLNYTDKILGTLSVCPSCGKSFPVTTDLVDDESAGPTIVNAASGSLSRENDPSVKKRKVRSAKIKMVSGTEYISTAVLMFDIARIREAEKLKSEIERNFSGFQSGLFFLGSFTSVVSRALILGMVEGAVSQQMANKAMSQLEGFYQACIALRNSGSFIELDRIEGIRVPIPQQWRVLANHGRSGSSGYLLYSDPCIAIQTTSGVISIMWDKVEGYAVQEE